MECDSIVDSFNKDINDKPFAKNPVDSNKDIAKARVTKGYAVAEWKGAIRFWIFRRSYFLS